MRSPLALIAAFVAGLLALPLLVLAAGHLGLIRTDATSHPPGWEAGLAHPLLKASAARRARGLTDPVPMTDAELLAGMKLFRNNCAGCHGDATEPSPWGSRNFYPRVPQFGTDPPAMSAPEIFVVIKHGVRYSGMGGWDRTMEDRDIWRAANFLSRLRSLPPTVDQAWRGPPKAAAR